MKTFLWIILVVLNILLVLAVIDAIRDTMRRRILRNMLSFKHKLKIYIAMCGGEHNDYLVYNDEEHIKQLQLTIYKNRYHGKTICRAAILCPYHNYYDIFDISKGEFDSVSKIIAIRKEKKS